MDTIASGTNAADGGVSQPTGGDYCTVEHSTRSTSAVEVPHAKSTSSTGKKPSTQARVKEDTNFPDESGDRQRIPADDCGSSLDFSASQHGEYAKLEVLSAARKSVYFKPELIKASAEETSVTSTDTKISYFHVPSSTFTRNSYQSVHQAPFQNKASSVTVELVPSPIGGCQGDHTCVPPEDCGPTSGSNANETGEYERVDIVSAGPKSVYAMPELITAQRANATIKIKDRRPTYFQVSSTTVRNNLYQSIHEEPLQSRPGLATERLKMTQSIAAFSRPNGAVPTSKKAMPAARYSENEAGNALATGSAATTSSTGAYCKVDSLSTEQKSFYSIPQLTNQERATDTVSVNSGEQETYFQVISATKAHNNYQSLDEIPFNSSTPAEALPPTSKASPAIYLQPSKPSDHSIPPI